MSLPIRAPSSSALRKWIPDQTRASTTSATASAGLVKVRVCPPTFVSVQPILFEPKKSSNVAQTAPLKPESPRRMIRVRRAWDQRRPAVLLLGSSVAVGIAGLDRTHRPPERPSGLVFPDGDERVRSRQVQHRVDQPQRCRPSRDLGRSRSCRSTAPGPRRILRPVPSRGGLIGGPQRAPDRADRLDLVELARVLGTAERPWAVRCEPRRIVDQEGLHVLEPRGAVVTARRGRQAPGKSGSRTKKPGRPHGGVGLAGRPSPVRAPIMAWAAASPTAAPASRATAGIPLTEALYCAR